MPESQSCEVHLMRKVTRAFQVLAHYLCEASRLCHGWVSNPHDSWMLAAGQLVPQPLRCIHRAIMLQSSVGATASSIRQHV